MTMSPWIVETTLGWRMSTGQMAQLVRPAGGVPNPQDEDGIGFGAVADQVGANERELSAAIADATPSVGILRQVLGGGDQLQGKPLSRQTG
jgi:hypothetical protein